MKRLIFTTLFLFGASLYAQDIITLRNGNEVRARITEISATEIRYLRFDNLDGPTRIIPRSDVFFIVYEDGTQEIITPLSEPNVATPTQQAEQQTPQILQPQAPQAFIATTPNYAPLRVSGCNSSMPGWGSTLGIISFVSSLTWKIIGNGITQEWSDAVQATACGKIRFRGGSRGNFNSDCRSNLGRSGDLFSWCAVARFQNYLCPYPWRVPTAQDFIDLDVALGGTGNRKRSRRHSARYLSDWGGGRSIHYWSLSEASDILGISLAFWNNENNPQNRRNKQNGFALRCVR